MKALRSTVSLASVVWAMLATDIVLCDYCCCRKSPAQCSPNTIPWTNCQGTQTYGSGDIYVGEFKNGKRSGQGTLTSANGAKYVGGWKDGNLHGQALSLRPTVPNTSEFQDGKQNGRGTSTVPMVTNTSGNSMATWQTDKTLSRLPTAINTLGNSRTANLMEVGQSTARTVQ